MNLINNRSILRLATLLATAIMAFTTLPHAQAQAQAQAQVDWPTRPVRIVVPYAPGGSLDQVARKMADKLSGQTGQGFFVENKTGGSGIIGATQVLQATPDGYTFMAADTSYTLMPYVFKKLPWDYANDFLPVVAFNIAPVALAVAANSQFKTLRELLAYAKANPSKLTYGTGGSGSFPNFAVEALRLAAGVEVKEIPYKGAGEATIAMMSGIIDFQMVSTPGVMGMVKGGKLRLLAVTADQRLDVLPDVPTFNELGLPQFQVVNFTGLWARAGTPPAVIAKLQKEVAAAMASPDFQTYARDLASVPTALSGPALSKMLSYTSEQWGKVAAAANIEKQ